MLTSNESPSKSASSPPKKELKPAEILQTLFSQKTRREEFPTKGNDRRYFDSGGRCIDMKG